MQPVLVRQWFRGRIWVAVMHWLLEDTPEQVVLALVPGCETMVPPEVSDHNQALAMLARGDWPLKRHVWHTNRVLKLIPKGAAHSLELWWRDADDHFHFWYVNLQEPLRATPLGFDTFDQALDIVINADQSWRFKDDDELDECVRTGIFTSEQAAAIRAEGERVAARLPELIPTGWENWRPDPSWPALSLPSGWDEAPG